MTPSAHPAPLPEVQGERAAPLDEFWLDTARGLVQKSVEALEEASKQLIAITSFAQVIYFAAISFSDIRKALGTVPPVQQWLAVIVLLVPMGFWFLSLFFAIQVFKPRGYSTNLESPDLAREMYEGLVAYKRDQLERSYLVLAWGFVPLIADVLLSLTMLR